MLTIPFALLLGITAGFRAMLPLSALSWAATIGVIQVQNTWLEVLGYTYMPYVLTLLAVVELVSDKLPRTPSRKVPAQFTTRVISGAIGGAALGYTFSLPATGLVLGGIGAILGTLGGAKARALLAKRFGKDLPAALTEDVTTIVLLALILIFIR